MKREPVRVLLVDPSPAALEALRRNLGGSAGIQVVATAGDGQEALELVQRLRPQVVCTALTLPRMDGLELTRQVMRCHPTPVLVLTDRPETQAFQLMQEGALDVLRKPDSPAAGAAMAARIRVLAGVKVFTRRSAGEAPAASPRPAAAPRLIAIGASTGGPQALCQVLKDLGARLEVPVLCVQHISAGFLEGMVAWLAAQIRLPVEVARAGQVPLPGHVYFAPEDRHLRVDSAGLLQVDPGAKVDGHRPSATVLLSSLAAHCGGRAVGVLLTGMGEDGAAGLLALSRAGGLTIVQDEPSSVVFGMARRGIEMGGAQVILPLEQIGQALRLASERQPSP